MPLIIRLGDTSTHGGAIVTAASKSYAEGPRIARLGDILMCPLHGPQAIVSGSPNTITENRMTARHMMDRAACGAVLISGAVKTIVNS